MTLPTLATHRVLQPTFSVLTDGERSKYRTRLVHLYGARGSAFPGANPVSMSRESLPTFHDGEYLVSLKSDGVRYVLYLTTREDGSGIALMVDRAWNMYEIEVVAPESYFLNGTVLEGELVWETPGEQVMIYLVFDCILCKGRSLLQAPFEERLRVAQRATKLSDSVPLSDEAIEDAVLEADAVMITHYEPRVVCRHKRFVAREHVCKLWAGRADTDHRVDGIVACRAGDPYVRGSALGGCMYKWKEFSTVDVEVREGTLHLSDGVLPDHVGKRAVRLSKTSQIQPKDGIVEYLITVDDGSITLFALRERTDKSDANTIRVFEVTVTDVLERIRIEELHKD